MHGTLFWFSETSSFQQSDILTGGATNINYTTSGFHSFNGSAAHPPVLWYNGGEGYFTYPSTTWNGTKLAVSQELFTYRMFSADGARSTVFPQYIEIQNENDPTDIYYDCRKPCTANEFGQFEVNTLNHLPSDDEISSFVVLDGFVLLDPDRDVDLIRVDVASQNGGLLTLNTNYLSAVDFSSYTYCYQSRYWSCLGDGSTSNRAVFVGTPWAVGAVLNGMRYESANPGVNDNITITLYDGEVSRYGPFCYFASLCFD